jgi:hypothetical protein
MWRRLIVPVVIATIVVTSGVAFEWAHRPKSLAAAEQAWRQAGIENYTLDIAVDGCIVWWTRTVEVLGRRYERREDKRDGSAGPQARE